MWQAKQYRCIWTCINKYTLSLYFLIYASIWLADEIDDRIDLNDHPFKVNSFTIGGRIELTEPGIEVEAEWCGGRLPEEFEKEAVGRWLRGVELFELFELVWVSLDCGMSMGSLWTAI